MYYCGVCATQAASQGFKVNRIVNQSKKERVVPQYPEYSGHPRYQQIQELMRAIQQL